MAGIPDGTRGCNVCDEVISRPIGIRVRYADGTVLQGQASLTATRGND